MCSGVWSMSVHENRAVAVMAGSEFLLMDSTSHICRYPVVKGMGKLGRKILRRCGGRVLRGRATPKILWLLLKHSRSGRPRGLLGLARPAPESRTLRYVLLPSLCRDCPGIPAGRPVAGLRGGSGAGIQACSAFFMMYLELFELCPDVRHPCEHVVPCIGGRVFEGFAEAVKVGRCP